jgi:glycosyltransferase involved in cell wall biosynthesis
VNKSEASSVIEADDRAVSGRGDSFGLTVMQVLPDLETGGVERGTVEIAAAIVAAGGKAIVVSAGGAMAPQLERAGAQHIIMPVQRKSPLAILRNARRLVKVIKQNNVDLVHARSRAPAWAARAAARKTGCAFVTTFHGTYNFSGGPFGRLKKIYNSVMTSGARVIAISEFIARHIIENYGTDPARISVVHRGVDLSLYDASLLPAARVIALADNWRLPDGLPVVMLPGRLTRWKGQALFIEALAQTQRDDFVAVIVGSDQGRESYVKELHDLVRARGLESVVRFTGHCGDMPAALMLADVVVSASTDPEAFGRVLVEAQAMGRPVIAPDHGAAPEIVTVGETGWLFKARDAASLATAINAALDIGPDDRQKMAADALDSARQKFSHQNMCDQTLEIYRQVAAEVRP